jgi:hypothetical protein
MYKPKSIGVSCKTELFLEILVASYVALICEYNSDRNMDTMLVFIKGIWDTVGR